MVEEQNTSSTRAQTLGQHLRARRLDRDLSQEDLAAAANVSVDVIRKLEQGQRGSARLTTITALAHALDTEPGYLLGKPRGLTDGEDSEVLHLRRAILGVAVDPGGPINADTLSARASGLWDTYWSGRYAALAAELPSVIIEARAATRDLSTTRQPATHGVLAGLLQLAAALMANLAHEDLAHLALAESQQAAVAASDELQHAAQDATRAWVLTRQGLWPEARLVAIEAATRIEPSLSRAPAEQIAVWGELLRYAVTATIRSSRAEGASDVTRASRAKDASDMLGLMRAAAAALPGGQRIRYGGMVFGPAVAAMKEVDVALTSEEPRRALELATQVRSYEGLPPALTARYLLNVAHAQMLDWKSPQSLETLRRVQAMDGLAPGWLRYHTLARETVGELYARRHNQRLPGIVRLAEQLNVA